MLCEESNSPVKRSGGERRVGSRSGSLGGGREDVLVMSVWPSLDCMLSCFCCFEGAGNGRLVLSCLFADAQVSRWTWGGGGGEASRANLHERVAFLGIGTILFLLSVVKEWKKASGCCDCIVHSPTPWCRGRGGLGRGRGS